MTTTHPDILPGFDDTEALRELRFHLRELLRDLTALRDGVQVELPERSAGGAAFRRLRRTLEGFVAGAEHDAGHHARRALALARREAETTGAAPSEADAGEIRVSFDEAHALLEEIWVRLRGALAAALESVARAAAMRGDESGATARLSAELEYLSGVLSAGVVPDARRGHGLAAHLHGLADPAAAAEDRRDEELATPLRELVDAGARTLVRCPHCGASLDAGDRTPDGSYCEACRTRWRVDPAAT